MTNPLQETSRKRVGGSIIESKPTKQSGWRVGVFLLVILVGAVSFLMSDVGGEFLSDVQADAAKAVDAATNARDRQRP